MLYPVASIFGTIGIIILIILVLGGIIGFAVGRKS